MYKTTVQCTWNSNSNAVTAGIFKFGVSKILKIFLNEVDVAYAHQGCLYLVKIQ